MFDIEAQKIEGYIRLVVRGPGTLKNFKQMMDEIAGGKFDPAEDAKYLIDLRPIEGTLQTGERFELGTYMAEKVRELRIAAISKRETYSKVGENVAVNRGAHVFSTDDEAKAREWILLQTH